MSTQSAENDSPTPAEPCRRPAGRGAGSPTERAFVVQFDRLEGPRMRLRGRVELVSSGETIRFRSIKQLVGFMERALRGRPAVDPET